MDKTIKILKNALKASPDDWETRRHLAELLQEQGYDEEARALISEASEIPSTEEDQLFIAELFLSVNPTSAASQIDWVLKQNKGNAKAHWLKAQVFEALGLREDAVKHRTTASVLDDQYAGLELARAPADTSATKQEETAPLSLPKNRKVTAKKKEAPELSEKKPLALLVKKSPPKDVVEAEPEPEAALPVVAGSVTSAPAVVSKMQISEEPFSKQALSARVESTQKKAKQQNQAAAVAFAGVLHAILILITIIWALHPGPLPEPGVIMSVKKPEDAQEQVEQKAIAQNLPQRPSSSSASRANVVAANTTSPLAVPMVEIEEVTDDVIGAGDSFGMGSGWGNGDGGGGGGAVQFFGDEKQAKRVLYIVDYSGSMASQNIDGDSRIQVLKNELIESIEKLAPSMRYTVVFFSGMPWLQDELPGNQMGRIGRTDIELDITWYSATKKNKEATFDAVRGMPLAPNNSGTLWMGGLSPSSKISPKPDLIFFLTDGVSQDYIRLPQDASSEDFFREFVDNAKAWDSFLAQMLSSVPKGVPINTVSMEMPGTAAARLAQLAARTGGDFSIVKEGKTYTGKRALGFGDEKHNSF